jgi:hypothetical protein
MDQTWSQFYRDRTGKDARINTAQLDSAEIRVKVYRNRLHDPIQATLKDAKGTRLIPKRDKVEKYNLWTRVMFDRDLSDLVPVESQLRDDFSRVCSSLQDFWAQIEKLSRESLQDAGYQKGTPATELFGAEFRHQIIDQDSSSVATPSAPISASGSFNFSDSPPPPSDSERSGH